MEGGDSKPHYDSIHFEVAVYEKRKKTETDKDLLELERAATPSKKQMCVCVCMLRATVRQWCFCTDWQAPTQTESYLWLI